MSRVAKMPVVLVKGVTFSQSGNTVILKGSKGSLPLDLHTDISVVQEGEELLVKAVSDDRLLVAMAGTTRALLANMVIGVSQGFERKLQLVGVGYRAASQGNTLNLTLGFSHPVSYAVPEGVSIETPSQTEIVVRGNDKQKVGQVAADIRAYRPPEPYKGKGVRYSDERVVIKEAKKK
ncbi:MAG: 50S ribosomal protein L6 [Gammaproteobacteria bacterium]|nr:50S ribosomal protein L6 [Gammaproteobacteria bacterium]